MIYCDRGRTSNNIPHTVAPSYGIEIRSLVSARNTANISNKMEKLDSLLAGKVKALRFTSRKTDDIVKKGNKTALERHRDALNSMLDEETKFTNGDSDENVESWGKPVVEQLEEVDGKITDLNKFVAELVLQEKAQQQEEENKLAFHTRQEQLVFERKQFEQKLEFEAKMSDIKKIIIRE